jgi:DNA-directed DNA polymerase III PolC
MEKSPTSKKLIPLHCHTVYSVLDGASDIDEYIGWCKRHELPGLAVTDHGWLIGAMDLIKKSKKADITPLPGCEFYLAPDQDYVFGGKPYHYYHVTAWAINEIGYRNLLKLGSLSFKEGLLYNDGRKKSERVVSYFGGRQRKPRLTFDELLTYNEGIILGSGCLIGSLNKAFLSGENRGAERNLNRLLEVYRGRLFVEIMPHRVTHDWDRKGKTFVHNECTNFAPDGDVQKACNCCSIDMARNNKLPLLMTVDSHFVKPEQHEVQTVLLQNGNPDGWHFYNSYHMLTTDEAWKNWKDIHGGDIEQQKIFSEAVENNYDLIERAKGFSITDGYHQPSVRLDKTLPRNVSESEKLKLQILRSVDEHKRMKWDDKRYVERLRTELSVVCDNGIIDFSSYFIFLEQWNRWTRDHSILSAPGRGSGAGSLLCYLLKITHLNPFRYALPFERFLSQGRLKRGKFPDIDWDLGNRDVLLAKLSETYGERFAQCSTHGTLKVKSALKDACRVILGWNSMDPRIDVITKTVDITPQGVSDRDFLLGYTDADGHSHDGHLDSNIKLRNFFNDHKDVYEMVLKLLGIPRSVGRHASAYFISDQPIHESVPTCTISGHRCTQYTANPAEAAGLIKFDFLRVNTLSDVSGCIRLIQQRNGHEVKRKRLSYDGNEFDIWEGDISVERLPFGDELFDVYDLPDDPSVYREFDLGNTATVFQMNTPLLTNFCKRILPRDIRDLSAIVALVRPGPLSAVIEDGKTTMTEAYIQRKHGEMPVTYAHPDMEPILKETYGVAVYQEQIQQMFSDLAGYSPEGADEMREILAKKKRQKVEKSIPELKKRLKERGWVENQIQVFVNLCIASASYSFNKCVSGDTYFLRGKGRHKNLTIKEMWEAKEEGKTHVGQKYKYRGYGKAYSMKNGRLFPNKIVDIRNEGIRTVYRVETKNGAFIKVTKNHKFPTPKGEKLLSDIVVGDELYVNAGYEQEDSTCRFNEGVLNTPKFGQSGFQKLEETSRKLLIKISRKLKKEQCKCQICNRMMSRKEIHHIDGDHGNQKLSNLSILCPSCHKKEHYKMGRRRKGEKGALVSIEKIVSIKECEKEEVFDIEMEHPFHNFAVDTGIVTSNSHSASYATVAYQCMFLKKHYPLEWWSSVLQNAKVEDIRDKNYANAVKDILVLPHVNGPMKTFELLGDKVHAPLYLIDGVGPKACQVIEQERIANGDYCSFQDFFERVNKRFVSKDIVHKMILCGAFDQLKDEMSVRDRLRFYHQLRRVTALKCGQQKFSFLNDDKEEEVTWKVKTGDDLIKAVEDFKGKLDVPELYQDDVELEVQRLRLLPIYRLDVHSHFKAVLERNKFLYGMPGQPKQVTYNDGRVKCLVLRTQDDLVYYYDKYGRYNPNREVGWVGLVQKCEEFVYKDKRTKQQVTALKLYLANDGDSLECLLWPSLYGQKGKIRESAIIFCKGKLKPSRESGKWSMSVQDIKEI